MNIQLIILKWSIIEKKNCNILNDLFTLTIMLKLYYNVYLSLIGFYYFCTNTH